ncbi:DNA-3-methyladenine glycosylase [Carboxylicivirga marina]|uniref:Putative 3-methyladenine DNA glycosylase n=1 Tax=Carboxylicivirga marina TaxID=2800988 RepID=A0ABS1HI80_9BACT|nr:DNA-3-methyladenine glycosylase [Carboxylicivirga marina]MBK3517368.1 DNA-3-methyladenine glycosylase [Carboxylicivirga marina]
MIKEWRLGKEFYQRDVLIVAKELLGKVLVRRFEGRGEERFVISEVEAYRGEEDAACHAHKGRTSRTEIMYHAGGKVYVYLIYGMYWNLNIVTGSECEPQAVLIRGVKKISGPGRLGRYLKLDKSFYGDSLSESNRLWIEEPVVKSKIAFESTERIGIDYAPYKWRSKKWRFVLKDF